MLPKKGDIVTIRWHDDPDAQNVVGKDLEVISDHNSISPYWVDVKCEGKIYSVRGAEALVKSRIAFYTKKGDPSPISLDEWKKRSTERANIISQNRSRNMRGMPQLPVPEKLDRPCRAIAYEADGTYCGALEKVEDAPPNTTVKFEPAL